MHPSNDVGIRSEIMRKADLCAAALLEAERVSGAAMLDMLFARLMSKITDMLEELDEELCAWTTHVIGVRSSAFRRCIGDSSGYRFGRRPW